MHSLKCSNSCQHPSWEGFLASRDPVSLKIPKIVHFWFELILLRERFWFRHPSSKSSGTLVPSERRSFCKIETSREIWNLGSLETTKIQVYNSLCKSILLDQILSLLKKGAKKWVCSYTLGSSASTLIAPISQGPRQEFQLMGSNPFLEEENFTALV